MKAKHSIVLAIIASASSICGSFASASEGKIPQWWVDAGIAVSEESEFSPSSKLESHEPANVGQLMGIAELAAAYLNERASGGAGSEINGMVGAFRQNSGANSDEYFSAVTVGQVINVAKPFYDRLHELQDVVWPSGMQFIGGNGKYPWPDLPENAANAAKLPYYDAANVGQIKYLFSWSISKSSGSGSLPGGTDTDGNGIPDWWEHYYFGSLIGADAGRDFSGDGKTVLLHYRDGTEPARNSSAKLSVYTPLDR